MDTNPLALIIEDHEDQILIFTEALRQAGYETEAIQDGITAQKRLAEVVPDMIVLDLHISGVSGEDILRQIRCDRRLANARVILATADAVLAAHLEFQADLVLLKPISFSQLSQLANRFIRHPGSKAVPPTGLPG